MTAPLTPAAHLPDPPIPAGVRQRCDQNPDWLRDFTRYAIALDDVRRLNNGRLPSGAQHQLVRERH